MAASCSSEKQAHHGPKVTSFTIVGNETISSSTIKDKIVTESTGWWPFAARKDYDPVTWDKDQKRMKRLYGSRGFYHAEITADEIPHDVGRDPSKNVKLKVTIKEGPRATVNTLKIQGDETLAAAEKTALESGLPLVPKEPFVEPKWDDTKGTLKSRLLESGHAEAAVTGRALVDLQSNQVNATVWMRPGPIYHFGDIELKQTKDPHIHPLWIEEQVRLAAPKGEVFTPEAVEETQKRVYNMGVFSRVDVETGEPNPQTKRIPLVVSTTTAPFHLLRLGGGAGFDQVRNQVHMLSEWHNSNYFGGLRSLRLRGRLGWAFLPDVFQNIGDSNGVGVDNGPIARVRADFEQPRLFNAPAWKLGLHIEGERMLEQAYKAYTGRTGPEIIWQIRSDLRVSFGYTIDASYLQSPSEVAGLFAGSILGCDQGQRGCMLWNSFISQRVTFDRRDDPFEPRKGYYFDLDFQEAGGPLSGSFSYLRAIADARGYHSWDWFTIAGRAQAGSLFSSSGQDDDTPIQQRLYAGGGMSMRGFGYRRLSRLAAVLPPGRDATSDNLETIPIGGNGLAVGNLETRFAVSNSVLLAAFYDVGAVTAGSWAKGIFDNLYHAVGLGIRVLTPVGALRLDFARRFPGSGKRDILNASSVPGMVGFAENTSCFGFGGNASSPQLSDGLCQIHLSIGEAF